MFDEDTAMLKEIVEASINACFTRQSGHGDSHNVALARLEIIEDKIKAHLKEKGVTVSTFYDKEK